MPSQPPDAPSPFADDLDREIARMVVAGAPNKLIARKTGLALGTVKWRLHRMYRRLGVTARTSFALTIQDQLEAPPEA